MLGINRIKISGAVNESDAFLSIPSTPTTELGTPIGKAIAWDETTGSFKIFNGSSWGAVDASATPTWNQIDDPSGNNTLAFAGFTNTYTSTLNGGTFYVVSNTVADVTVDTILFELRYADDGDANGIFFRCRDNTSDDMFVIAANGATTITGSAAGTSALTLTAGDVTMTAGHLVMTLGNATLTNGNLTLSSGGLDVTAGSGDGDAVDIVNLTAGAAIDIDVTAATTVATGVIDIDASTGSAPILTMAFSGAYTGTAIVVDMTNAVGASALSMTGAGTRTTPFITITDVPTTSAPTLDLNLTAGTNAVQSGIDMDVAGTATSEMFNIDFSAAFTGDAVNITMTNCGAAAQAIVVDGSLAASGPIVEFVTTGILTNAGSVLTVKNTTQPGAASTGVTARFLETGAAQATTYCVKIDSTSNEALNVSTGKSHFSESITVLAGASSGPPVFAITANYIATESGANNAIAGALTDDTGTAVALTAGLVVVVKLGHTLQAGANTFNLNGGGALAIVSSRNSANNIGTAYADTGVISLLYNGATWSDLSQ